MTLDVLIFAAHPDDAELTMGGTVAKLTSQGFKVGIVDVTRGELGTRGTPEIRQKEAFQAAIVLKVATRENLNIPDGDISDSKENLVKLIMCIRKYKPKILFGPYMNDRHPDHIKVHSLVKSAHFSSGLPKIKTFDKGTLQEAYRPAKLFYYMQTYTFDPSFIIDISDHYEDKIRAMQAYGTQFHNPHSTEPDTFISSPEFQNFVRAKAEFYGFKIGKKYGEPFYSEEEMELDISGYIKALK